MTYDLDTLPQIGDEYVMFKNVDTGEKLDETIIVEAVTKRGRGYQVHTKFGRFRLKDFLKITQKVTE